jgi:hypothetical protein
VNQSSIDLFKKNFAKDLNNLHVLVTWAAEQPLTGSFSQRRPDLGRMFTCPFCRIRRRQGAEKCCSHEYAKTQRAWDAGHNVPGIKPDRNEKGFGPTTRHEKHFHQVECEERVVASFFPKSFLKKLTHKRHGQNKFFKIRQLARRFAENDMLLHTAVAEIRERWPLTKMPKLQAIPAFAERYWLWKQTVEVKREKTQARESRRINRGA